MSGYTFERSGKDEEEHRYMLPSKFPVTNSLGIFFLFYKQQVAHTSKLHHPVSRKPSYRAAALPYSRLSCAFISR